MADDTPETSFELTSQTEGPFFSLTVRTLTPFSTDSTLAPSPSSSFLSFLLFFFPLFFISSLTPGVAFGAVLWQLLSRGKSAFQRSFIFPFVSRQPYSKFKRRSYLVSFRVTTIFHTVSRFTRHRNT